MNKEFVENVCTKSWMDSFRKKYGILRKDLTDREMKAITRFHNQRIGNWILDNADGFMPHKKAGNLVVSKYIPIEFHDLGDDYLEDLETRKMKPFKKAAIISRIKHLSHNLPRGKKFMNLHSFFYTYKMMWFNKANCDFKKGSMYTFNADKGLKRKMGKKILAGKDYFEWNFHEFTLTKEKSVSRSVIMKRARKAKKLLNQKDNG